MAKAKSDYIDEGRKAFIMGVAEGDTELQGWRYMAWCAGWTMERNETLRRLEADAAPASRKLNSAIELNIADVWAAIREYVEKRTPGVNVVGVQVKSWNQVVFQIQTTQYGEIKLVEPIGHIIKEEYKEL